MNFKNALAGLILVFSGQLALGNTAPAASEFPALFDAEVTNRLSLEAVEVERYQQAVEAQTSSLKTDTRQEFFVLVDRAPKAQRLVLFLGVPGRLQYVGAVPVSTGTVDKFDHFLTPLGVFEHTLLKDFRSAGTLNDKGIRGYGQKGMRVWDLGWTPAERGWGALKGQKMDIRFQLHATDPTYLEKKLGSRGSKGCVRVPGSLNAFMDKYGVLDHAYDERLRKGGKPLWVLRKDRVQTEYSGRFIVVVDSSIPTDSLTSSPP